ncbi:ADP-ribosylglycohydrolase [Lachnotalea glycerini]|uniref:ADP-ribosylglycohydrolase n=1 Tax=Lachnotalea glycerini TaxID=1763509 RepID=A0A318EMQ6_9FIRM|nr:ADP-ribosylglycohydrolase family protein [Lachnotalea glycerini]PXV85625.1 ADP-ribosylglycohydrolase [Lachnotalea glycerini]RDY31160.1 ADP-ribosylglycohydrolase family protein [Lachnotalea glycerini]
MGKKQLTLVERWELDIKAYEKGVNVKTSTPQCKKCRYFIKKNALHCDIYINEKKPRDVMFCHKECLSFNSNNILDIGVLNEYDNRLYGGIFGFCIGDMLGVPVEFSTREERDNDEVKELRAYGTYHQPFGAWSDDTSMMLCLIDAFNYGFSMDKLAENFVSYYKDGKFTPNGVMFDIGISTQNAIEKIIHGIEPVKCGGSSEMDNGNGSLMRILPLAYLENKYDEEQIVKLVENVSSITHSHDRSKLACILYVELASQLIQGKEKLEAYEETIELIRKKCNEVYSNEFKNFEKILNKNVINFRREEIKSTGYVIDTLEAVLWLFFNKNSYEEMVLGAVNLGGDTDTIAAIVGGLSGIYYGFNSIPDRWVQNVERKKEIMEMISCFFKIIND